MKFTVVKKGYNRDEVDSYLEQSEHALSLQKERILKLKRKIGVLEKELESYYEKKDLILSALSEAVKKAQEIEQNANKKYDLEIQRLRQFHEKWTDYYNSLVKKHTVSEGATDDFNRDMERILKETEWNIEDEAQAPIDVMYKKEQARLQGKTPAKKELTPLERIKNYLDNDGASEEKEMVQEPADRVFNLEEALNPQKDLAGIMKDLGLIED